MQMIEGGFDVGIVAGGITDESVVARPAGRVERLVVAAPALISRQRAVKIPSDLEAWPWVSLSGVQFGGSATVSLVASKHSEQTIRINPVLISEGVTSMREAVRAGLGVAVLPEWLVRNDLASGKLVRLLPQWKAREFSIHVIYQNQRRLPLRVRAFVDFAVASITKEMYPEE
jgi:DNA-binding transcriptional LysR family regulator